MMFPNSNPDAIAGELIASNSSVVLLTGPTQTNRSPRIRFFSWSSMSGIEDKPENYVIVTYQLSGENENVTLTVLQENIPDEKMKTHSEENWNKVLKGLKKVLEEKLLAPGS